MEKNTHTAQLRVAVIGLGPVGTTLAAHLIEAGAFVVTCDVDREKTDTIKKAGLRLEHKIEKQVTVPEVCYSAQELKDYELDVIAVAVKTPNLKVVLSDLSKIDMNGVFILCAQNGLDNEKEVAATFGAGKTLRMAVNYAGGMTAPNTVHVVFFNPPNYIAALAPEGEAIAGRIAETLNAVSLKTEMPDNIQRYIWEKAILNSALSPVCAITGLTMKEVMDSPQGLEIVESIIAEAVQVAEADGIVFGEGFSEHCLKYLQGGGKHKPSMLLDLENGLRTEIDYLNGRIVEYGRKHNLPTPYNQTITGLIRMLETSAR